MSGSTFGRLFRVTTFGESHGPAIGVIVDGVPPNLPLTEAHVQKDLDRRRPGQSKVATPRQESDTVEIVSGTFDGVTMGPPVAMLIRNRNQDPSAYLAFRHKFRPGHADYSFYRKYGLRDWRGSGRASGRETACRVAAGAVAKQVLARYGIEVVGYSLEIAGLRARRFELDTIEQNIVRTPDPDMVEPMIAKIQEARDRDDSVGGVVEVIARNVPPGLGDPVFDKLEARLAHAVMSIGAVKGFEIGLGFAGSQLAGSEFNDPFAMRDGQVHTASENSGNILGGISVGGTITLRAAVRPPASIATPQQTINVDGEEDTITVTGRHDPCIVPRAVPVVEAMVAIALADALLVQKSLEKLREDDDAQRRDQARLVVSDAQRQLSEGASDPGLRRELAEAYLELGEAVAAASTLAEFATTAADFECLGRAREAARDLPGAIAAYEQALERDPELTRARYNLATAKAKAGD